MLSICLAMLETGPDQRRFTRFFEAREKKSMRWPCGSWEIPTEKTWSTLIWTDPETGICFRIRGNKLSKETMLRIAESVEQGSAAPWSAEAAAGGKAPLPMRHCPSPGGSRRRRKKQPLRPRRNGQSSWRRPKESRVRT